jgi:hypothetical protein
MSDWLERELARGLAPVAAPEALRIRLGLARAKRRTFPPVAFTVAAAVALIIGGSVAAGRTAALDLRSAAGVDVVRDSSYDVQAPGVRLARCDGGAGLPVRVNAGKPTVLLAHSTAEMPAHPAAAAPEAGCHLCHSL